MILTIGMIVKNEEKYLERCLNGIKPILDNVDSELIITDTGSTDRTVEIAHKFTDKVLHFDWINDFAAARNFGLKKAQGEWFMFLDADEIFESCDGIIKFFNSGKYKKFCSALYTVRNLTDSMGNYTDFCASRMTRIFPATAFHGKVHEHLKPLCEPTQFIPDIAVHYGYMFEDEALQKHKGERNVRILSRMVKEAGITDSVIMLQLSDAYFMAGDSGNAEKALSQGMEYCRSIGSPYIVHYYLKKAFARIREKNYQAAIDIFDDYFRECGNIRKNGLASEVEIYIIKAEILYNWSRYEEAKEAYKHYFRIYDKVRTGEFSTLDISSLDLINAIDAKYIRYLDTFFDCCIRCEDYDTAAEFASALPVYEYPDIDNRLGALIDKYMTVLEYTGYRNAYKCFTCLDNKGKKLFSEALITALYNGNEKKDIIDVLSEIGREDPVIKEKVRIYEGHFINNDMTGQELSAVAGKYGLAGNEEFFLTALESRTDLSFMLEPGAADLKMCVYVSCKRFDSFYSAMENYPLDSISRTDLLPQAVKIYDYCISMRLMGHENSSGAEKEKLIKKLVKTRNALNERYLRAMRDSEFEQLASVVKRNIQSYIEAGNTEAALKTLEDYKKLSPDDPEITELSKKIHMKNEEE